MSGRRKLPRTVRRKRARGLRRRYWKKPGLSNVRTGVGESLRLSRWFL